VRVKGDPAPALQHSYPPECSEAAATYGKLFRTGQDGTLADALVAVTEYEGFVPPKRTAIEVGIRACAFSTRTIGLTDEQHIEVKNLDLVTSYLPELVGANLPAKMVAMPRGDAIRLRTRERKRHLLRDLMGRDFMRADVFHLPYATFAVTGLDGKYAIEAIPVGKVKVSVLLPAANMKTVNQPFEIKEGESELDLTMELVAAQDFPKP
jgi:hypothetical protein